MATGAAIATAAPASAASFGITIGVPGYYGPVYNYCDRYSRWYDPYRCGGYYPSYYGYYGYPAYYGPSFYYRSGPSYRGGYVGGYHGGGSFHGSAGGHAGGGHHR
jgi:hypothetical protein